MGKSLIVNSKKLKKEKPSKFEVKIKTAIQNMSSEEFFEYLKSTRSVIS